MTQLILSSMRGEVTHKTPPKINKRGDTYRLLSFRLEDGRTPTTYVVLTYKNASRWADIEKGDTVEGLRFKGEHIDADSPVRKVETPTKVKECTHRLKSTLDPNIQICEKCNGIVRT